MKPSIRAVLLFACGLMTAACAPSPPSQKPTASHDEPALHNLMQVAPQIYSGGEPDSPEAFAAIAALGVKTIVSVDGATPNVALARQHGLKYVHAPFGYDSVDPHAALTLTRVVRQAEGPFYVHCHHGKHRGPAGAAVMCLASGQTDRAGATRILERVGTSREYHGLWRDVAAFEPPGTDVQLPPLVQVAPVESLAHTMAGVDRAYDHLKLCREAGWQTPANHPDIVPAREALLIKEAFYESARNLPDDTDPQMEPQLRNAQAVAAALETALRQRAGKTEVTARFETLSRSCVTCHRAFRQ